MGWPAHNPEAYEELERNAAVRFLLSHSNQAQFLLGVYAPELSTEGEDHEGMLHNLVDYLQGEESMVFQNIMEAGAYKLIDESEYFDRFVR